MLDMSETKKISLSLRLPSNTSIYYFCQSCSFCDFLVQTCNTVPRKETTQCPLCFVLVLCGCDSFYNILIHILFPVRLLYCVNIRRLKLVKNRRFYSSQTPAHFLNDGRKKCIKDVCQGEATVHYLKCLGSYTFWVRRFSSVTRS